MPLGPSIPEQRMNLRPVQHRVSLGPPLLAWISQDYADLLFFESLENKPCQHVDYLGRSNLVALSQRFNVSVHIPCFLANPTTSDHGIQKMDRKRGGSEAVC